MAALRREAGEPATDVGRRAVAAHREEHHASRFQSGWERPTLRKSARPDLRLGHDRPAESTDAEVPARAGGPGPRAVRGTRDDRQGAPRSLRLRAANVNANEGEELRPRKRKACDTRG